MRYSSYHVCYHVSPILCTGVTVEARSIREAITKSNINEDTIIYVASLEEVHRNLENGKKLKLMATNKGRALDLCAIVTSHPIKSIDQAVVQIKIESLNPN